MSSSSFLWDCLEKVSCASFFKLAFTVGAGGERESEVVGGLEVESNGFLFTLLNGLLDDGL